jgi:hypothetical protein
MLPRYELAPTQINPLSGSVCVDFEIKEISNLWHVQNCFSPVFSKNL